MQAIQIQSQEDARSGDTPNNTANEVKCLVSELNNATSVRIFRD